MWDSYSRPAPTSVAIVGTGASFITPSSALTNGRPADATRIQWLSNPTPAITDVVKIQFQWATAFVPGLVGLIGINALGLASQAGIKIAFMGKRAGDTGFPYDMLGNCDLQRTITRSDGSTFALGFPAAGLTPIVGLEMQIYNDQNGSTALTPSQYVDLGDIWFGPAFDVNTDADWKLSFPPSPKQGQTSINNQPWPVLYPPARKLTCKRSAMTFSDAFVDGATPAYQTLRTLCGNGQVSVQIPRYLDTTGALDVTSAHATACFGLSTFTEIDRMVGDYFAIAWEHQEIPALLA
ncbi:MAG: hypothetical protein ACYC7G_04655 [Rudaea sp.]